MHLAVYRSVFTLNQVFSPFILHLHQSPRIVGTSTALVLHRAELRDRLYRDNNHPSSYRTPLHLPYPSHRASQCRRPRTARHSASPPAFPLDTATLSLFSSIRLVLRLSQSHSFPPPSPPYPLSPTRPWPTPLLGTDVGEIRTLMCCNWL